MPLAPQLSFGKRISYAAAAVALFFAAVEAILALVGVAPSSGESDPFVGFSGSIPLFVETVGPDGAPFLETNPAKALLFNRQSFPRSKPPGAVRIFTLGGSTTYGHPYDDTVSFGGWLRELLTEVDPAGSYEVVNAGGIGYASYRVAEVARELAAYEPDVFLVYSGHNEFLERRTYPALAAAPRWFLDAAGLASRTRLFAAGRLLLPQPPRAELPSEAEAALDRADGPDAYRRDDAFARAVERHFEANLGRIVEIARRAGARTVLAVPAPALRGCRPFKSEPPPERDASVWYARAKAAYAAERWGEAREAYLRAIDEDICPLRATTPIREAVRRAAGRKGVPLVDFEAALAARSEHGSPGPDWFVDHVHLTPGGYRLLALEFLGALQREGVAGGGPPNETQLAAATARVEARLDPPAYGRSFRNLARVLAWAGKLDEAGPAARRALDLLGPDAESYVLLGRSRAAEGDAAGAGEAYRAALAADPAYADAYARLGALELEAGRFGAASVHLAEAVTLDPGRSEVVANYALALARSGRAAEADEQFARALELDPEAGRVWSNWGLVLAEAGRLDEAAARLARAIELDSGSVESWTNLGLVHARAGRWERAERALQRAVQLRPASAEARFNWGVALQNLGRTSEAAERYRETLTLDPSHGGARRNLGAIDSP